MKPCSWCSNYFTASVSYQIYCSATCRDEATKEKIVERHKATRRQKRNSKERFCVGKCGTRLSIYNDHIFCDNCYINQKEVNKLFEEFGGTFPNFPELYEEATKEKYNFLCLDFRNIRALKNFDVVLWQK